ncbi:insulinase family protein [Spirochaetia bacterium 38H-sp]|uniref:Insulinase family protein n=1 Tax=Rarispira pelagica TaxID=3141764 RepID=A0ABU9UAD3_9SPIR
MSLSAGDRFAGFIVKSVDFIEELSARGILCVHERTGAQVYHVNTDDRENLFCFSFKTLPDNNKGIPHILEHSVLCGSEAFPVKDPFAFLMRSSLSTFLNAMTYPDRTLYPAGSVVEEDYFNLMRVYGDAVFFPLLKREAFLQEGHRLELSDNGLHRVGVVYNEMKGVFSDPEALSADLSFRGLFPDCNLGFESGGVPEAIADLSYQEFMDFYRKNYNPAACKIVLYGNIATEKQLEFLDREFLSRMEGKELSCEILIQPEWSEPRRREEFYGADKDAEEDEDFIVSVNWKTAPLSDRESVVALEVLSEILLGTDAAPLRKALLESGLGEDVAPSTGYENELFYSIFSAGLKGVSECDVNRVEDLVLDCLSSLAEKGIPSENIEAAFRKMDFRYRELYGKRNAGLVYIRRIVRGWIYDVPPAFLLDFLPVFDRIRKIASSDSSFFPKLIKKWLLDNRHRLTLIMRPRPGMFEEEEKREQEQLDKLFSSMSEKQLDEIRQDSELVSKFQSADDRDIAAKCIPVLELEALPKTVEKIEQEHIVLSGIPVYLQPIESNGVVYVDIIFSLDALSDKELYFIPLLVDMLEGTSTPEMTYDQVAIKMDMLTGGLSVNEDASTTVDNKTVSSIIIRVKMLETMVDESVPFITSYLSSADVSDRERLRMVLGECRQDFVSSIVSSGNSFMTLRSEAAFSSAMAMEERWKGVAQFFFLDTLSRGIFPKNFDELLWSPVYENNIIGRDFNVISNEVGAMLVGLKNRFMCRENVILSVTGKGKGADKVARLISDWASSLPSSASSPAVRSALSLPLSQGFVAPSKVSYVAAVMPAPRLGDIGFSELAVAAQALKSGLLWERIRMKGGAYGASAGISALEGTWSFSSYRDPNSLKTVMAYEEILQDLAKGVVGQKEIEQAIRGLIGKEIAPQSPSARGYTALRRAVLGITDDMRQKHRDSVLSCSAEKVRKAAEILVDNWQSRKISVLGDDARIEEIAKAGWAFKRIDIRL